MHHQADLSLSVTLSPSCFVFGVFAPIQTRFAPMFPFQQLPLYKKSQQFYVNCRYLLSDIKVEKYIHDQLGRASYSIVLNIAEGSAKVSNADRRN
jgi:hypothetical protein